MTPRWWRLVPALALLVLLTLVALVTGRAVRAGAPAEPAAPATVYPNCDVTVQAGGSGSVTGIANGAGVTQPLLEGANVSACSLQVGLYTYNAATMSLVCWDPLTLTADPTTLALRSTTFDISTIYYGRTNVIWAPPLVTRAIDHLAEAPRPTTALEFVSSGGSGNPIPVGFQALGPDTVPVAFSHVAGGAGTVLSGPHPVLTHRICGGDSTLEALRLVQSVMSTQVLIDTAQYEIAQRFRVPVEVRLRWIELAFGRVTPRYPVATARIAILDAEGDPTPPLTLTPELVGAVFGAITQVGVWTSHYDFDQIITLEPRHDYWLVARTAHSHGVYARVHDGHESADFISSIGTLAMRTTPAGPWVTLNGEALCFRMVGEPTGVADVPNLGPERLGLRLGVSPNPARGPVLVRWASASGPLRFEVLDARGRRVGGGYGGAGATGGWTWSATNSGGGRLPAGVYFIRATDRAGRDAHQRVVLIR